MDDSTQKTQALSLIQQIMPHINNAERQLTSARTWGFIDIFGGGLLTDLIKHSKINKASYSMQEVNYLMQQLQQTLSKMQIPSDYTMHTGGFSTFADFLFDGAIFDIYMTSKIMNSLNEVRNLKDKLIQLERMLNS